MTTTGPRRRDANEPCTDAPRRSLTIAASWTLRWRSAARGLGNAWPNPAVGCGGRQGRRHRRARLDATRRPSACGDRGVAAGGRGCTRCDALCDARAVLASRQDAALRRRDHRSRDRARRVGDGGSQSRTLPARATCGCARPASLCRVGARRRRGAARACRPHPAHARGPAACRRSSSRCRRTARSGCAQARAPVAITGEAARRRVHFLRATHDAIMIGIGTALADNPQLTCRLPGLEHRSPVRIVLDRAPAPAAHRTACHDRRARCRCGSSPEKRHRRPPKRRCAGGRRSHPAAG